MTPRRAAVRLVLTGLLVAAMTAVSSPIKPGKYKAKVTTAVTGLAGNRFDGGSKAGVQPLRWRFRV